MKVYHSVKTGDVSKTTILLPTKIAEDVRRISKSFHTPVSTFLRNIIMWGLVIEDRAQEQNKTILGDK